MESIIIFIGGIVAGLLGALTGLGGGIIIIPLLTLGLGYDMKYAIGAGLISVIGTSTGGALRYMKEGISNVKIGLFLVVATTFGAVCGAVLAQYINTGYLSLLFGGILLFTAYMQFKNKTDNFVPATTIGISAKLQLQGSIPQNTATSQMKYYQANKPIWGFIVMIFAGALSGLLGIGSGVLKVLAMDSIMKLPFKVSTTTSTYMIGLTAIASAALYLYQGYIVASIDVPVLLGVLLGATIGSKLISVINIGLLKKIFASIVVIIAINMMYKGISILFY
jgi:uncharacterized membrane protein YfcA